jgi:hypothetical protein
LVGWIGQRRNGLRRRRRGGHDRLFWRGWGDEWSPASRAECRTRDPRSVPLRANQLKSGAAQGAFPFRSRSRPFGR